MKNFIDSHATRSNSLLSALNESDWAELAPHLELVDLRLGQVLFESGQALSYASFPTSAIISLLQILLDGDSVEIAVVGNEGVVGVYLFMGGDSTVFRAVVQCAGQGYRVPAAVIKDLFARNPRVQKLLLRYTQALITQSSQTAVCNRHHTLDQQLCRWLLMILDRGRGNELILTQELIASIHGVRREGVTLAAQKLQEAGLIRYSRGRITVQDRAGLEKRSCECYGIVKAEYARLLWPGRT